MPITLEYMRYTLLTIIHAFGGRRGKSGVLAFLRGEATPGTVDLGAETGVKHLYGVLRGVDHAEVQEAMAALLAARQAEIRKVESGGKELPLLFITETGRRELLRLAGLGFENSSDGLTAEKLLSALTVLAAMISKLRETEGADLCLEHRQLSDLLAKSLGLKAEVYLGSPPGRLQFASLVERSLHSGLLGFLSEVEAQCLRLFCRLAPPQQLDEDALRDLFGVTAHEAVAHKAAEKIISRNWPHRTPAHSVITFFAIARRP